MDPPSRTIVFRDFEPSRHIGFSAGSLDRLSEHREDTDLPARLMADPAARLILFVADRVVLKGAAAAPDALWPVALAGRLGAAAEDLVLLGLDRVGPVFALAVERLPEDLPGNGVQREGVPGEGVTGDGVTVRDLRSLAQEGALPPDVLAAVGQGRSLTGWHARHRFCANCGTPTRPACHGYRRDCPSCAAHHFPRTDPVVIMLAIAGEGALLGRQHRFRPGMYSCLAGFVEPGETLEDAVRREILEEAKVTVGAVAYHASQPWPFPSSLMIGCFAEALTTDVTREEAELEDARFFGRDEVRRMLAGTHPDGLTVPPPMAIAHHLIAAYVADG